MANSKDIAQIFQNMPPEKRAELVQAGQELGQGLDASRNQGQHLDHTPSGLATKARGPDMDQTTNLTDYNTRQLDEKAQSEPEKKTPEKEDQEPER